MVEPVHPGSAPHSHPRGFLGFLERGDEFAHQLVSLLLLITALGVLGASTYQLVSDIVQSRTSPGHFAETALTYLSDLLFAVILLELLSTLLTYVKSKNLESTIKDFLIVGIISSVRKILLVGAQSSLEKVSTDVFVKESVGTVITIVGILLLIGGLWVVERRRRTAASE